MRVQLRTLGRLAMTVDGVPSTAIGSQPMRMALLIFLAVERRVTRRTAAGVLWTDRDESRARHALSQTLYQLRSDLGEGVIVSDRETLGAGSDLWVDAVAFADDAEAGRIEAAVPLYRGPFLPDARLAETNAFETWVDMQRARLARMHRRVRREQIQTLIAGGGTEQALQAALAWAGIDPFEDEAQHQVIRLLAELGRTEEALRRFDEHARLLAREDLEPLDETKQLAVRIRTARAGVAGPAVGLARNEASPARARPGLRHRLRWAVGVLVAACLGLAGITALNRRRDAIDVSPDRVLVVPFANETGDAALDPVGDMAADWLAQALAGIGRLQVVPTIDVLRRLQSAHDTAPVSPARSLGLARETGAGLVVTGRYYRLNGQVQFFAQITDARSGRLWYALEPVSAAGDGVEPAIEALGTRVMGSLAARLAPDIPLEPPAVLHPPTWDAWLEFREGGHLFIAGDFDAAIPHLLRATSLDSTFVRPLLLAASAYGNLGDVAHEDSLIRAVSLRADRLAPYERAHTEYFRDRLRGDLPAALAAGRRLIALAPGGPAQYAFGAFTLDMGRPRETLEVYGSLALAPAWMPGWWNSWSPITGAYHALGEHRREMAELERVLRTDRRLRMRILEARALTALGRLEELEECVDSAVRQPADRSIDPGAFLWSTANELAAHGHDRMAEDVLARALEWYDRLPAPTPAQQWTRARVLGAAGRFAAADSIVVALRHAMPDGVDFLGYRGELAAWHGDHAAAAAIADTLAALTQPYLLGQNTYWRAAIAARDGRLEEAVTLLRQAWDEGWTLGFALHADPDLRPLWRLPVYGSLVVVDR